MLHGCYAATHEQKYWKWKWNIQNKTDFMQMYANRGKKWAQCDCVICQCKSSGHASQNWIVYVIWHGRVYTISFSAPVNY